MRSRVSITLALVFSCLAQTGCSIFSPLPLWELTKATTSAAGAAIPYAGGKAVNTVYHLHVPLKKLCIEYDSDTNVADVVPALQIALSKHQIESRVYEARTVIDECPVWLKYRASIEWDIPPMEDGYKPYLTEAALTLRTAQGEVLSSTHYAFDSTFGLGKWASTERKLAPVVAALLTGFD